MKSTQTWNELFESQFRSAFRTYGVPLLAVAAAISFDALARPVFHRNPFLFFYGAVMASAVYGGFRSGVFSTLLSALAVDHLISPVRLWNVSADDLAEIGLFVSVGLVSSALSQTLHTARARLEARLRQQASLAELGRNQSAGEPLQNLLQTATQAVADVLRVEYCKILELSEDGEHLVMRAGVGWKPGYVGTALVSARDGSQGAFTLGSDAAVILRDVRTETRFTAPPLLNEHEVFSGLSVCICGSKGHPWGVLGAHSKKPHAFTQDDVNFVQGVANLVALWVQHAYKTQQLADSEARFRTLAESLPQMSWSTTAEGALDYISKSWCDFTGMTMEESLGNGGWQKVLHPDDAGSVVERWQKCLAEGIPYEVECRLRAASGEYRWVLTRGVPLRDSDGHIHKWFGTCTDIHTQRLAEEAMRDSEKLKATARLAMTAAHEINNPLAAITNLIYLSKQGLHTGDPNCAHYIDEADRELHRVTYMVRQTLGFYNDNSMPAITDPAEIVREVLSVYKQKINSKELKVEQDFGSVDPLLIARGDLRQVIAHVLLNAIDASPIGGTIRLRLCCSQDWRMPRRPGVRVMIADQGTGIQIPDRARLFQPFFTTKSAFGTGLGLWTVKGILERHAGTIRFKSAANSGRNGTVFNMFFPAVQAPEAVRIGKKAAG